MPHPLSNILMRLHATIYRRSKGGRLNRINSVPVLLMSTTGRKSGKRRTTPLMYVEDGDDLFVVGSNAGRSAQPGWIWNLQADPIAKLQVGGEQRRVHATFVESGEREPLWDKFIAIWPTYAKYQSRTDRDIPIVRLHRIEDE